MVITAHVQKQFFSTDARSTSEPKLIRLPPTVVVKYNMEDKTGHRDGNGSTVTAPPLPDKAKSRRTNLWSVEEHNRFLHGLEMYPQGPWKHVAAVVGTKTTRQTMTHAQKYRQKIERRAKSDDLSPRPPAAAPLDAGAHARWTLQAPPAYHAHSESYIERPNCEHARLLPRFADKWGSAQARSTQGHDR